MSRIKFRIYPLDVCKEEYELTTACPRQPPMTKAQWLGCLLMIGKAEVSAFRFDKRYQQSQCSFFDVSGVCC